MLESLFNLTIKNCIYCSLKNRVFKHVYANNKENQFKPNKILQKKMAIYEKRACRK